MTDADTNRVFLLADRPEGVPDADTFDLVERDVPDPGDGEVQVRTLYLSVDPYMRGRMRDRESYADPWDVGEPLRGGVVGEVVVSNHAAFERGDALLEHIGGRIHEPRVDVAEFFESEQVGGVFGVAEDIGGGPVHRDRAAAGGWVRHLACVKRLRIDFVAHDVSLLISLIPNFVMRNVEREFLCSRITRYEFCLARESRRGQRSPCGAHRLLAGRAPWLSGCRTRPVFCKTGKSKSQVLNH